MQFGAPTYLYLLFLIPVITLFYWVEFRNKHKILSRFGNIELLRKLTRTVDVGKQKWKAFLLIFALFLLIIAVARPQIGTSLELAKQEGIDILIAIDTSTSMLAEDFKPNRLIAAKLAVSDLINRLSGDRVGLVAFAGTGFVQCPLTSDYSAARMFLDTQITPDAIPQPGTAIGEAIRLATKSFVARSSKNRVLILLTDGEDDNSKPIEAAKAAKKEGIRIYTIGIGSISGEPIPNFVNGRRVGFKKDRQGNVVLSRLDEATLREIATITGGKYYRATIGGSELDAIFEDISQIEKSEYESRFFIDYEERFQYVLGVALLILMAELLIGDRRKSNPIQPE
ncbi:MAG: VWA domain-containing protein [Gemmatimonadetes bacterium]|nr:MAG: VWA domain-containing protein [Gemmatimonadota bacterium]